MQIIIHRVGCTNQQEIRNNKIKDAFPFGKASFIIPLRNLMNIVPDFQYHLELLNVLSLVPYY